jgi:hypothetical protein
MFTKSSTISSKLKVKEAIIDEVKNNIYSIERMSFKNGISKETVIKTLKDVKETLNDFELSVGSGKEDLTISAKKIKRHLIELNESAKGNLEGRFIDNAMLIIEDLNELIDLENGVISVVTEGSHTSSRTQDSLNKKIKEIADFGKEFTIHRNRVEEEILKIERDKKELDEKILKEKNKRIQNQIFNQINAKLSNIKVLQIKSDEYSSCQQLLESIMIFSKELVAMSDFSKNEFQKAKIIMNVDRLKLVLDDPKKLQPILKSIEHSLLEIQERNTVRDTGISVSTPFNQESSSGMEAYIASLKNEQESNVVEKDNSEVDQLDEVLEEIRKNRNR